MKIVKRIAFLLVVFLINLPLVSALSVDNTELTVAKGEKSTVKISDADRNKNIEAQRALSGKHPA